MTSDSLSCRVELFRGIWVTLDIVLSIRAESTYHHCAYRFALYFCYVAVAYGLYISSIGYLDSSLFRLKIIFVIQRGSTDLYVRQIISVSAEICISGYLKMVYRQQPSPLLDSIDI